MLNLQHPKPLEGDHLTTDVRAAFARKPDALVYGLCACCRALELLVAGPSAVEAEKLWGYGVSSGSGGVSVNSWQ